MALAPGTRLGPYEILAPIGAGGMGEVYKARDTRLGRDVAIKVLPESLAADPDRLRRFEQEARATGLLNHPNILVVFDVGTAANGAPYVVSELLEGQTLRDRLADGAFPVRKAVDIALQMARGLAAAHDKGLVHRDLKPENLFLTDDGRLKILDFGLAKLTQGESPGGSQTMIPTEMGTGAGVVLGTAGYMSPEQVRARAVDHRTDIFALGAVLFELLSGTRAFQRETAADTLSAILKEDPPELSTAARPIPAGLERIVRYCLEKSPADRFQSARDLGLALEAATGSTTSSAAMRAADEAAGSVASAKRSRLPLALAVALALAIGAASFVAGRLTSPAPIATTASGAALSDVTFQRLTFRPGTILEPRFAPDGQSVVFAAEFGGNDAEVHLVRPGSAEMQVLGIKASLSDISASNELLVIRNNTSFPHIPEGTLGQVSLNGGAIRDLVDGVAYADWAPNGKDVAVVRRRQSGDTLEYPVGTVLYETPGTIELIRVSPDGEHVAFFEGVAQINYVGYRVAAVSRQRQHRVLVDGRWSDWWSLTWHPNGEVWYVASPSGTHGVLRAVDLQGRDRVVAMLPGTFDLNDIGPDGRAILTQIDWRLQARQGRRGQTEINASWHDMTRPVDLSADGRVLLFREGGDGAGETGSAYLRREGDAAPVRLGPEMGSALSPDLQWVAAVDPSTFQVVLLPTGAGQARRPDLGRWELLASPLWLPQGDRLVFEGRRPGEATRIYSAPVVGGAVTPVAPEGYSLRSIGQAAGRVVSPDGQQLVALGPDQVSYRVRIDGQGSPVPIRGIESQEHVLRWSADGTAVFVTVPRRKSAQIVRVNVATGQRQPWHAITPPDRTGLLGINNVVIAADGQSYAYSMLRDLSTLYLVTGLK